MTRNQRKIAIEFDGNLRMYILNASKGNWIATEEAVHFFVFWPCFFNREMNPAEIYFQDLAPLSHASPVGVAREGVTPCALA
jgi:hypothetical protein